MKKKLPQISLPVLRFFRSYTRRLIARNFYAVRLSRDGFPPAQSDQPTIVFLNHSAWWDPLACLILAERFFPRCASYAPIAAAQLRRYPILKKIGMFGMENENTIGGRRLLEIGTGVLSRGKAMLWITPESRFVDVRKRPLRLASGLSHLLRRVPGVRILPLALEYTYWQERRPELLARFGSATYEHELRHEHATHDQLTDALEQQLSATMDALAQDSLRRDPAQFVTLLTGGKSVTPVYDFGRHVRAFLKREAFDDGHAVADA